MARRLPKKRDDANLRILRLVHDNPNINQRELAEAVGVSLGKLNYCLRALLARGLMKIGNFRRSDKKLSYAYVLTPRGISQKTVLTAKFLKYKIVEYEELKAEIESLERELAVRQAPAPGKRSR